MLLGYNTNGLGNEKLLRAVELLAGVGYRSVAITLDDGSLNPYGDIHVFYQQLDGLQRLLEKNHMRSVIETQSHFPRGRSEHFEASLMSPETDEWARRIGFLTDAVDVAKVLGSDCVTLGSGMPRDDRSDEEAWDRLVAGLKVVVDYAASEDVLLGFVPEPDTYIDTMQRYEQLLHRIDSSHFRLNLNVGHLHCLGEVPIEDQIRRWAEWLVNVHLEDMRAGVHEHLMFGQGEIDFPPVIDALAEVGYHGAVHVELSQYNREGVQAAKQAFEFLSSLVAAK